jgi:hypothetical protein
LKRCVPAETFATSAIGNPIVRNMVLDLLVSEW